MLNDDLRPRRSVLYMPGANERALEKAKAIPADALILDLEDAVAPDAKAEARARVCAAAGSRRATAARRSRSGPTGSTPPWHADDLARRRRGRPGRRGRARRSTRPPTCAAVEKALEAGGAPDHTRIWAMLETPDRHAPRRGDRRRPPSGSPCWCMGTNDLAKELHAEHVPGRAAAAARARRCACSPPARPAR